MQYFGKVGKRAAALHDCLTAMVAGLIVECLSTGQLTSLGGAKSELEFVCIFVGMFVSVMQCEISAGVCVYVCLFVCLYVCLYPSHLKKRSCHA